MSVENYDGLCGLIPTFASSKLQLRCNFCIGHAGPCSWEKYRSQFVIVAGAFHSVSPDPERGFINSVLNDLKKKK